MRKNSKTQLISHENSIQKSNELSMAKLNQGLTLNQMQLLAFSIYSTQQNGLTEFHKADFERKFGIDQYRTEDGKKDADKITSVKFSTEDMENEKFSFWNVFMGMDYEKGLFKFEWNPKMIPHILELKEKYITTDLNIASKFKSSFTWTLYDYIRAHYGYWHKPITKEALMRLFGVENVKSYQNNSGIFKKRVLDVAIKEINDNTELNVWYKVEKDGRSIKGFDLIWSNGEKLTQATKKQILEINRVVEIIFDDMFEYININDENDRQRAIDLIRETEDMRGFIEEPICITKEKADSIIKKANKNLKELNQLLEKKSKPGATLYNWLDENE